MIVKRLENRGIPKTEPSLTVWWVTPTGASLSRVPKAHHRRQAERCGPPKAVSQGCSESQWGSLE